MEKFFFYFIRYRYKIIKKAKKRLTTQKVCLGFNI